MLRNYCFQCRPLVCQLAALRKEFSGDFHETLWVNGLKLLSGEPNKFCGLMPNSSHFLVSVN